MKGHPVIALVIGNAISGGFLTHGYQANRILAFDDAGVVIHAMHKEAAARNSAETHGGGRRARTPRRRAAPV